MMNDYINYINGLNDKWEKYKDKRRVITRRVDKIEDKNDIKDFEIDTVHYKMKGPKVIKSYDFYDDWEPNLPDDIQFPSNLPDDIQFPSKLPDDVTIPNFPYYPQYPYHYPLFWKHSGVKTYATSFCDNESKFKKLQKTTIDHDFILEEILNDLQNMNLPIYDIYADEYTIDVYVSSDGIDSDSFIKMDVYFDGKGNIQYDTDKSAMIVTYPFACLEGCE